MSEKTERHGWYSAEAEQRFGSFVCALKSGTPVIVTTVMNDKDSFYGWPDKEYRGIVTEFISDHKQGSVPSEWRSI